MDPLVGAAIAGGVFSSAGQVFANQSNKRAAQRQMDFQREMSNTSFQRGVQDMRAAGLNPLYYLKGGGASTPGGSMSQAQNPAEGLSNFTARSLEAKMAKATIGKTEAETKTAVALSNMYSEQARQAMTNTALNAAQLDRVRLEMPGYKNKEAFEKSWLGKVAPYLNFGLSTAKDVVGIVNPVVGAAQALSGQPNKTVQHLHVRQEDGKTRFSRYE